MMAFTKSMGMVFAIAAVTATAIQVSPMKAHGNRSSSSGDMDLIMLNEDDVESRGSHCLDGSTPGYLYKEGKENKWLFWFQGGSLCLNESECADELPLNPPSNNMDSLPLMETGEFSSYHHVYLFSCDFGLFLGDNPDPVDYQGTKLYFQGKRVVDHILDTLQTSASFGTATEVLFAGGSGGGQASFAIADYLSGIMPTTVQKFGAAPINGWHAHGEHDELKYIYTLANMGNAVSTSCKAAFSAEEQYKCVIPQNSYTHSTSPMFMTQFYDYTFKKNETLKAVLKTPYTNCLSSHSSDCTEDDVSVLQEYLNTFTETVQNTAKWQTQGGFISTCTEHTFYNDEDKFGSYANDGTTVGDAISTWWAGLKGTSASTPAGKYLPCTLASSSDCQCESTCDF